MSDKFNLLKDVFVPIAIAGITMKLTTEHDKKIKKENYRIELYYIYESFREILKSYYSSMVRKRNAELNIKEELDYKEVISRFNTFISKFKNENKLTLKETKALLDLVYNIDSVGDNFYSEHSLLIDKSEEALLIESGLSKIYYFLHTEKIEKITLYTTSDIIKIRKYKYGKLLQDNISEEKDLKLKIQQLEEKKLEMLETDESKEELIREIERKIKNLRHRIDLLDMYRDHLYYQLKTDDLE